MRSDVRRRLAASAPASSEMLEARLMPTVLAPIAAGVDGYARDANRDGVYTVLDTGSATLLNRNTTTQSVGQERSLIEFDLTTVPTNYAINSATLTINVSALTTNTLVSPTYNVIGYTGNGALSLSDATIAGTQIGTATVTSTGLLLVTLDPTFVRAQEGGFLGIRLENPTINGDAATFSATEAALGTPTLDLDVSLAGTNKAVNIDERRPNGTVVTDASTAGATSYAITGGDPGGVFAISPTGIITVANSAQLLFALQQQYVLDVQATLPNGINGTYQITVNVKNLFGPNNPPVINPAQFSIEEFSPVGTTVGTVTAVDPDSADPISFSITGGNTGNAFKIDPKTGVITVINQDVLNLRRQTSFVLQVNVKDTRNPQSSVTANIPIFLTARSTAVVSPNSVQLKPSSDGEARDNNNDGTFDAIDTTGNGIQIKQGAGMVATRRGVLEFDLSSIAGGKVVKSAFLTVTVNANTGNSIPVGVFGYAGDGTATASDATLGTFIGGRNFIINSSADLKSYTIELDPAMIQQILGSGGKLGLVLRNDINTNTITIDSSEAPGNLGTPAARQPSLNLILADQADDVVFVNTTNQSLSVAKSDGTQFTTASASSLTQGLSYADQQTGDFNGDGRMDILSRNAANGQILVNLAKSSQFATATAWTTFSTATPFKDILVGDFNNDGKDDIVGRNSLGQLVVGKSTGTKFSNTVFETLPAGFQNLTDVRVGDVNGDGRDDLVGRVAATGQVVVSVSSGTTFTTSVWGNVPVGTAITNVAVGDFNGDGRADVVMQQGAKNLVVLQSTGTAFKPVAFGGIPTGTTFTQMKLGDFNGDGLSDLVGVTATGALTIFRSTGSTFAVLDGGLLPTAVGQPLDFVVGDFNRDGKSDILTRTTSTVLVDKITVTTVNGKTVTKITKVPQTNQDLYVSLGANAGPFTTTLWGSILNSAGPFKLLGVGNF